MGQVLEDGDHRQIRIGVPGSPLQREIVIRRAQPRPASGVCHEIRDLVGRQVFAGFARLPEILDVPDLLDGLAYEPVAGGGVSGGVVLRALQELSQQRLLSLGRPRPQPSHEAGRHNDYNDRFQSSGHHLSSPFRSG